MIYNLFLQHEPKNTFIMTTYQSDIILNEVNNLITYSCRNNMIRSTSFHTMYRAIIKKHFNAFDVTIREEGMEIDMKIRATDNEYVNVSFKCPNLENFLKSCIENDRSSLSFYQNMLTYYNVTAISN